MANDEEGKKLLAALRRRGLKAAFREPSYDEVQAFLRMRPHLELQCPNPEELVLAHNEVLLDEAPTGWTIMDIGGTRLLTSPGEHLYDLFPYEPQTALSAASHSESGETQSKAESASGPEGGEESETPSAQASESGAGAYGYMTFWAQAIMTTEYLMSMVYNYEWPSVNIRGSDVMQRPAWILCNILDFDNDYAPSPDDERCYQVVHRYVEKGEELAPEPGKSQSKES